MPVTIHDVAKFAGVASVTVSRVINGATNVKAETRAKVERAIEELGYVPNVAARSLRSQQNYTLALIVTDITTVFWTTVARGVEDAAQSGGYSVLLCNTDENPAKQMKYVDAVLQQRVDGVIIAPYSGDLTHLNKLRDLRIPTVIVDRRVEGWDGDSVRSDSIAGAQALTQHLISVGHRRIAMISGPVGTSTADDRVVGYSLALHKAGISLDPHLIRRGQYQASSGRKLADELFDEGLNPSAIVAANGAIAMGVIEALRDRGMNVPQDVALVCFDETPDMTQFFPFLTTVTQPAYDIGVNAAQLLLSRIGSETPLYPRHIILPSRLVLRYSCGRFLAQAGDGKTVSLKLIEDRSETVLVKPLEQSDREILLNEVVGLNRSPHSLNYRDGDLYRPNIQRLLKVLHHQEADRVPYFESGALSTSVLEYVLGRRLLSTASYGQTAASEISPEDRVEFAQRLGIDVVPCEIDWQLGSIPKELGPGFVAAVRQACPPLSLAQHFSQMESFLRAAQGSGVGVYASFSSFFDNTMRAVGEDRMQAALIDFTNILEELMDMVVKHQAKVIRAICDRFWADLSFVSIRDDLFCRASFTVDSGVLTELVLPRMKQLIAPAKEHDLLVALDTCGTVEDILPALYESGFDIVQSLDPRLNDLAAIKERWQGKLAFVGGMPTDLLVDGSKEAVEAQVREFCESLAPGGGFVLGRSPGTLENVLPQNYVAMIQAIHQSGYWGQHQ